MRKEEKAHFGQTIRTEGAPDRSSHKVNADEAFIGRKMKGGPTDLEQSMKAGSYNDVKRGKSPSAD